LGQTKEVITRVRADGFKDDKKNLKRIRTDV
jgi:hypothetical protein